MLKSVCAILFYAVPLKYLRTTLDNLWSPSSKETTHKAYDNNTWPTPMTHIQAVEWWSACESASPTRTSKLFKFSTVLKARILYISNNWIYTTNHKRISVNYFYFVIFSGIVGAVLATIIRLEMAYPGVGILAGDSLQYLTVVTAHAVVMVFFMIMPLLFGAFANFLLPTQLGVHDVAFPRLNSAAFWFLPAGFIMLCQMVCIDRRYQRMNCFNIREIQTLVRSRYNSAKSEPKSIHHYSDDLLLATRYKLGSIECVESLKALYSEFGMYDGKLNSEALFYFYLELEHHSTFVYYSLILQHKLLNSIATCLIAWEQPWDFLDLSLTPIRFPNDSFQVFPSRTEEGNSWGYNPTPRALQTFRINWSSYPSTPLEVSHFQTYVHTYKLVIKLVCELLDGSENPTQLFSLVADLVSPITSSIRGAQSTFSTLISSTLAYRTMINLTECFYGVYDFVVCVIWTPYVVLAAYSWDFDAWICSHLYYMVYLNDKVVGELKENGLSSVFVRPFSFYGQIAQGANEDATKSLISLNSFTLHYYLYATLRNYCNDCYLWAVRAFQSLLEVSTGLTSLLWDWAPSSLLSKFYLTSPSKDSDLIQGVELHSASKLWSSFSMDQETTFSGKESTLSTRRLRSSSPVVGYNFKVGDFYPSITIKLYPSIFRSISDLTRGVRRAAWFFSPSFHSLWKANFGNYMHKVVHTSDFSISAQRVRPTTVSNNSSFYNFFYLIANSNGFINSRWLSINTLDQKFYRMFMSSTMQQRIYTNWRHLKFTREAWRCRLLASRHQKTLYKRFTKEESLVWSVEKNAKDVLPGWAMITPFSGRVRYTAIGKVDLGLMGVFLVLNSSIVSSANFLVTYRYLSTLNNRKMRDARSFFTEGVMVASWMMIAANPMLAIGILMLLADRHWQTCFFDYSGGGDTVLFQHMFWFFGHPEVYVIMIPAFGFNNTILSFYLRKRVSARASLMYSMYTIAFLGFFVWGHHMYMVGLAHTTRMLFSTLTVMISVPAATKLMHWCVTLVNSSFWVEVPFICSLFFIFFFVSGGISGMAVAHTGMDVLFHDSFYVIGHFHVMFAAAAMVASFGAFYFYFPSIFGLKFSRIWAYLHLTYFVLGQIMTVVPMLWLGYSGMPRRILDYPASLGGWHAIISAGHLLSIAGLTAFFIMIFDSMRQGRPAVRNTFGVSRFNTRLSFYLYESARLLYIQHKGSYSARFARNPSLGKSLSNYSNNEVLETTLFSYILISNNAPYSPKDPLSAARSRVSIWRDPRAEKSTNNSDKLSK